MTAPDPIPARPAADPVPPGEGRESDELSALRADRDRLAARSAELERGLDLSSGRFVMLHRAAVNAWERLAGDLENPSLRARAEALQWAADVMLGSAAGLPESGVQDGD